MPLAEQLYNTHSKPNGELCRKNCGNLATERFADNWTDYMHGIHLVLCRPCLIKHLKHKVTMYNMQIKELVEDMKSTSERPRIHRASGIIEILCEHGTGHPTKESVERVAKKHEHKVDVWMTHGCDGCCSKPGFYG